MARLTAAILLAFSLILSGCRTTDPRGPVAEPTIVKPELKKTAAAVKETAVRTQTVYRTVEKIVEKYPDDDLVKELQEQAAAAQEQAKKTEAIFDTLKLKVEKAQAELVAATDKLKQWQAWYNKEYEKRVRAEASAKRKGKWLLGSGIMNLAALAGVFLLIKKPF
jgi:hypothetical protein